MLSYVSRGFSILFAGHAAAATTAWRKHQSTNISSATGSATNAITSAPRCVLDKRLPTDLLKKIYFNNCTSFHTSRWGSPLRPSSPPSAPPAPPPSPT